MCKDGEISMRPALVTSTKSPFSSLPATEDETQNKNQNQQLLTVAQMKKLFQYFQQLNKQNNPTNEHVASWVPPHH